MDTQQYAQAAHAAVDALAEYARRTQRGEGPALARASRRDLDERLGLTRLLAGGGLDPASFGPWLEAYLREGVHLHHPGEMCHQVSVPDVGTALADLVHGVANQPMSIAEMGAAAAAVEQAVVDWLLERVGWTAGASGGVLTHGGSLANLTALLAARAHAAPHAWRTGAPADLALLAAPSVHYSVARAAGIMGIGTDAVVPLEVDELDRIRPDRLLAALERMRAAGRRPMALVAAACATATGLHDDLALIAAFCREHGIWLHVDAAHGASALLSPAHAARLAGIELADSIVWDAHKMLRASSLCAATLVRRAEDLPAAFQQEASYLDLDNASGADTIDRQVECTKAELGLKLFLTIAFAGPAGLADYVDGRYAAARTFWRLLGERPGFEAPYEPESNIVCFRFGDDRTDQDAIRATLLARGEFHLGCASIAGRRYLRVVLMSPATDEAALVQLLGAIEGAARG